MSGPGGGAAPAGDSVLCVSGRGTIWSSATSQATQKVREMVNRAKTRPAATDASGSTYLWLLSGVPPRFAVLSQQHLLVEQVHPLLPLDFQSSAHPQGSLRFGLGALATRAQGDKLADYIYIFTGIHRTRTYSCYTSKQTESCGFFGGTSPTAVLPRVRMRPGFQHWLYVCTSSQTHSRRAAPEHSGPPGTATWVRRGASVSRERWSGTESLRSENTSVRAGQRSHKPLSCFQQQPTHQAAPRQEPHKGTGGQQLEEKRTSLSFTEKEKESSVQ